MNKLNYPGDCRDFVPNRIVGPDIHGAWWLPVSAHYFDGVTTIYYKPVPPAQLPPNAVAMSKQVVAQQQIRRMKWHITTGYQMPSVPSAPQKSEPSSLQYQVSRGSGGHQKRAGSGGSKLTRSQRELLKRFRKPESR